MVQMTLLVLYVAHYHTED